MSTMPMIPPRIAIPWRAFLIAPLAAPAAYIVLMTVEALVSRPAAISLPSWLLLIALSFAAGAPIAYAATLAICVGVYTLLAKIDFVRAPVVLAAAAMIGAGVSLVLAPFLHGELVSIPLGAWRGALCGLAAGAVWWRLQKAGSDRGQTGV